MIPPDARPFTVKVGSWKLSASVMNWTANSGSKVGSFVLTTTAPAEAARPLSVVCGPLKTSTRSRSQVLLKSEFWSVAGRAISSMMIGTRGCVPLRAVLTSPPGPPPSTPRMSGVSLMEVTFTLGADSMTPLISCPGSRSMRSSLKMLTLLVVSRSRFSRRSPNTLIWSSTMSSCARTGVSSPARWKVASAEVAQSMGFTDMAHLVGSRVVGSIQ